MQLTNLISKTTEGDFSDAWGYYDHWNQVKGGETTGNAPKMKTTTFSSTPMVFGQVTKGKMTNDRILATTLTKQDREWDILSKESYPFSKGDKVWTSLIYYFTYNSSSRAEISCYLYDEDNYDQRTLFSTETGSYASGRFSDWAMMNDLTDIPNDFFETKKIRHLKFGIHFRSLDDEPSIENELSIASVNLMKIGSSDTTSTEQDYDFEDIDIATKDETTKKDGNSMNIALRFANVDESNYFDDQYGDYSDYVDNLSSVLSEESFIFTNIEGLFDTTVNISTQQIGSYYDPTNIYTEGHTFTVTGVLLGATTATEIDRRVYNVYQKLERYVGKRMMLHLVNANLPFDTEKYGWEVMLKQVNIKDYNQLDPTFELEFQTLSPQIRRYQTITMTNDAISQKRFDDLIIRSALDKYDMTEGEYNDLLSIDMDSVSFDLFSMTASMLEKGTATVTIGSGSRQIDITFDSRDLYIDNQHVAIDFLIAKEISGEFPILKSIRKNYNDYDKRIYLNDFPETSGISNLDNIEWRLNVVLYRGGIY